jgi:hypothetical protein
VAKDPVAVETLRATAGAPHTRTMPIYQPGINGNPGTLINVQITDPGVSDADAARMDLCGLTLLTAMPGLGGQLCCSPAAYADLVPSAILARQDLMLNLTALTWVRFAVWMAIGVVVYLFYGRRHSVLGRRLAAQAGPATVRTP